MPSRLLRQLGIVCSLATFLVPFVACDDDETTPTPVTVDAGKSDGPAAVVCSQAGSLCAGDEWCSYSLVGSCGKRGETAECKKRPGGSCETNCPGVCGCDGKIYCNACEAQQSGTDVSTDKSCVPSGGEVLAYALYTDPPKLAVFKKDTGRNVCMRLTLVKRLGTEFGLDVPNDWGVEDGEITHDVADCVVTNNGLPPTPTGTSVRPNGGQGRVRFSNDFGQQGKFPCSVSIAARFAFAPTADYPWVPNVEPVAAEDVVVSGGCP